MTPDTLPPANLGRWFITHKQQVVLAVRAGLITLEDACRRYALSIEEFVQWQEMTDRHTYGRDHRDAATPHLAAK